MGSFNWMELIIGLLGTVMSFFSGHYIGQNAAVVKVIKPLAVPPAPPIPPAVPVYVVDAPGVIKK